MPTKACVSCFLRYSKLVHVCSLQVPHLCMPAQPGALQDNGLAGCEREMIFEI